MSEEESKSDLELHVERIKEERKKMRKNALLLVLAAIIVGIALMIWQGGITGYASLETFEEVPQIAGSSPDNELSFAKIPNFRAYVGEPVRFRVNPNTDGVQFTDDTNLFDITPDGTVEFTPSTGDAGQHRVLIFIKKDRSKFYFQDLYIRVEEPR